jgi:hypothetical protein
LALPGLPVAMAPIQNSDFFKGPACRTEILSSLFYSGASWQISAVFAGRYPRSPFPIGWLRMVDIYSTNPGVAEFFSFRMREVKTGKNRSINAINSEILRWSQAGQSTTFPKGDGSIGAFFYGLRCESGNLFSFHAIQQFLFLREYMWQRPILQIDFVCWDI